MKVLNVSYNNFISIVKEKINRGAIRLHSIRKAGDDKNIKPKPIDKEKLLQEIKKFLKKIEHSNYRVNIKFHQKTKTYVIKIIDNETNQTIREAPLEKILDIISFMEELINKRLHQRR